MNAIYILWCASLRNTRARERKSLPLLDSRSCIYSFSGSGLARFFESGQRSYLQFVRPG